jgi:hypothetical protein
VRSGSHRDGEYRFAARVGQGEAVLDAETEDDSEADPASFTQRLSRSRVPTAGCTKPQPSRDEMNIGFTP